MALTAKQKHEADYVLRRVPLDSERAAWRWLLDRSEAYPADTFMPALKPPKGRDGRRKLLTARLLPGGKFETDANLGAAQELERLFVKRTRGHLIAFWHGGREAFHDVLRDHAPTLTAAGFTLQPLANGAQIKALIIRKGRQSWWLCDAQAMTGLDGSTEREFCEAYAGARRSGEHALTWLLRALRGFESIMLADFGVGLRVTLGSAAMRAASYHVPARGWVWRTPPLAVTMAREGGGYRGGYAVAQRYVGDAWRADLNKAYTSVLASALPGRIALGSYSEERGSRSGLFLCRVSGRGALPVYLSTWRGYPGGFELGYWRGGETLAIVPSSEFPGLRALGYTVRPGFGFVDVSSWHLRGFVEAVERASRDNARGSPAHVVAKLIGNSVYGKFAENPHRLDVMYAEERPGDEWRPYVTERGDEVPGVWEGESVAYRPHQHVNVAAAITGSVRSQLYQGVAAVLGAGGRVVHADTDGLLATVDPAPYLDTDDARLGAWRVSQEPELAAVWGRKGYTFGMDVRAAGVQQLSPEEAQRLAQGEELAMPVEMLSAPWRGAQRTRRVLRSVRATA